MDNSGAEPVFTIQLGRRVVPGLLALGCYDGVHPCLTAVLGSHTGPQQGGDKVLIHDPHGRSGVVVARGGDPQGNGTATDTAIVPIGDTVTALCCGPLPSSVSWRDASTEHVLCVGTGAGVVRVYDVASNSDRFVRQLTDAPTGVSALLLGNMRHPSGESRQALVAAGGCTIQAYDGDGSDIYWNVSGDTVRALALPQLDNRSRLLVVGSDDHQVRLFDDRDEIVRTWSETDAVTGLHSLTSEGARGVAYALANGTVGVYNEDGTRRWRIKSRQTPVMLCSFDINQDGVDELVVGWSSGKVDARNPHTGEIVFRNTFNCGVAGVVVGDYRMDGTQCLITCSVDGEVRGFTQQRRQQQGMGATHDADTLQVDQNTLQQLAQRKQDLLLELSSYEQQSGRRTGEDSTTSSSTNTITTNTAGRSSVIAKLTPVEAVSDPQEPRPAHVKLTLQVTDGAVIRAVILFAEGIFDGESLVYHSNTQHEDSDLVTLQLFPQRNTAHDMQVKVIVDRLTNVSEQEQVGQHTAAVTRNYHVVALSKQLPAFAMFRHVPTDTTRHTQGHTQGHVQCRLDNCVAALPAWLSANFLLPESALVSRRDASVHVQLECLRSGAALAVTASHEDQLRVDTDDIALAGDIVQSLCGWMQVQSVRCNTVCFPAALARMTDALTQLQHQRTAQQKLAAQMAQQADEIRQLVVRAEDSRLMHDTASMRHWYQQLMSANAQLDADYQVSSEQQRVLVEQARLLNMGVQQAARLHVGSEAQAIVAACHAAIKNNDPSRLAAAIETIPPHS